MSEEHIDPSEKPVIPEAPKEKGSWIGLILKIAFFFVAILLVVLMVMSNVGGKGDNLKKSIEEFVGETTPYNALIGEFNGMTFFPDITFDLADTEFYNKETFDLSISVRKLQLAFGFWDVMFNTGKIKAFNIEGLWATNGSVLTQPFSLDNMRILASVDGARIEGKGSIGEEYYEFFADMDTSGNGKRKKYYFGKERLFFVKLGDVIIKGKMRAGKTSGIVIENLEVIQKDQQVMTGALGIVRNGHILSIEGKLQMSEHGSVFAPDIDIVFPSEGKAFEVTGDIESEAATFKVEDFKANSRYDLLVTKIEKIFATPEEKYTPSLELESGTTETPLPMNGWHVKTNELSNSQ